MYVRGDWDGYAPVQLFDATGTGIYSGNVVVPGDAGAEVRFKYFALVGGENRWEPDFDPDGDRVYRLGPSDVPTFASQQPHIFGTLDPIAPQGVRTGEKAVFLPISRSTGAAAPCHGWFFQNFVAWDGNGGIDEAGVVYSRSPISDDGISVSGTQDIIWHSQPPLADQIKDVHGIYYPYGEFNGKPRYKSANGCIIVFIITQNDINLGFPGAWQILANETGVFDDDPNGAADTHNSIYSEFPNHSNAPTPDLVTNWLPNSANLLGSTIPSAISVTISGGNVLLVGLNTNLSRARSLQIGVGEFAAANPSPGAGYVFGGVAAGGLFQPGVIYYRAYAENEAGISYGEQRQTIVPADALREWRSVYAEADFFAAEDSTAMQKGVALAWQEAQGATGEWEWEIHRFESSQVDQNPAQGHRILASFPDSGAVRNGTQRSYLDRSVFPGWSYLYLIGIRDSQGLQACRAAWVNISYWAQPGVPAFTAQSQTPYSVTIQLA